MHVQFRSKIDSRKLSSSLIGSFLTELTFLKQLSNFSRNSNNRWKCRDQKENLQTVWANNFLVLTRARLLETLIFWHFAYYQGILQSFKENIKHVSFVEIPNLTVLCKQYFCIFSLDQKFTLESFHRHLLVVFWQN